MLICLDQRTGTGCGAQNRDGALHCAQCGRPLRFALQLQNPGAVVGHYRVLGLIGHGGFGAVYEAEDIQHPGLHFALKETFDSASIVSFQREFAVLRTLEHSNLPKYFEAFEFQGNGYLAMEFVPGQSLEEVLSRQPGQPLLESQVMGYALQVCDALGYLHSLNPPIFHRDIKPANIRITPAGLIKLVDFGLVKQGVGITQSSRRGLTPAYAPIEQYGAVACARTDARTDIYALGAMLYHLLSAQEPIPAVDRIAISPDPLPELQKINNQVSAPVANAIMSGMSLQQQSRPVDAIAFKQQLMGASGQLNPVPQPGKNPPVPQKAKTLPVHSTPPLPVTLAIAFCAITGVFLLIPIGEGLIGILSAILMWRGSKWGRRIGFFYLIVVSVICAYGEAAGFFSFYPEYDQLKHISVLQPHPELAAFAVLAALILSFDLLVLFGLFKDDVLDFFYPQHVPHSSWTGLSLAIIAWIQILFGFWLIFPAVFGFGLLYRKRRALQINRIVALIGTLFGIPIFLIGSVASANMPGGFMIALFGHLTVLVNSISWYVLTRREVKALF